MGVTLEFILNKEWRRLDMYRKSVTILSLLIVLSFSLGTATQGLAQEKILKPCYEGDELVKVREWEKAWVGKRIDSTNLDQVKDLLPPGIYQLMKDTKTWGEHWFEIVPYRPLPYTPGKIKYTKQGNCRIGPNDELMGWVAGVPFPEPKSGIEIAWNFECWSHGDGFFNRARGYTVDGKIRYDRNIAFHVKSLHIAGRCDVPPTPEFPDNQKGILRASWLENSEPTEVKGQTILQYTYKDRTKDDETWVWIPSLRKIRHISTAQRTSTDGGSDIATDDDYGRNMLVQNFTYKYTGRKELLLARHQDLNVLKRPEGDCMYSGMQKERTNTYVVEGASKDPNYTYSKFIWYVDPELWHIVTAEKFDREGRLWKVIDYCLDVRPAYQGTKDSYYVTVTCIDVKRQHATLSTLPEIKLGQEFPLSLFTVSELQRIGR
jgi:hypothetical protein